MAQHTSDVDSAGTCCSWVLVGSTGLWAADCLVPGCLWTITTATAEVADEYAVIHATNVHDGYGAALVRDIDTFTTTTVAAAHDPDSEGSDE